MKKLALLGVLSALAFFAAPKAEAHSDHWWRVFCSAQPYHPQCARFYPGHGGPGWNRGPGWDRGPGWNRGPGWDRGPGWGRGRGGFPGIPGFPGRGFPGRGGHGRGWGR